MKMPPKEKILEAYSAIADERITVSADSAEVMSSDRSKTYAVRWKEDQYSSTDNATYWQSYPGYPVIAVLLLQGRLTYREDAVLRMNGIPWKKLNDAHKRDYAAAALEAMQNIEEKEKILEAADLNYEELSHLDLKIVRKIK